MSSRASFRRAGVGLFSVVLGAVLLLMVGGLLAADRALTLAATEQARIDASESALVIEHLLESQVEGLQALRGAFLDSSHQPATDLPVLVEAFAQQRPGGGLRAVWVADAAGRVLLDTLFVPRGMAAGRARAGPAAPPTPYVASVSVSAAPEAGGRNAEISITTPLMLRGRMVGVAAASFDAVDMLAPVVRSGAPKTRARLVLRAANTTVLRVARDDTFTLAHAEQEVPLPGGGAWRVEAAHAESNERLRITLWVLGLLAAVSLGVLVLRERRQATRVAERSAELERLNAEVLRNNRAKSEFLASVSHELRTPLNAIVGFVEMLKDGVYGDLTPRQAAPVERISASATHLRHLVDQVLDIAKIAAGRLEVHPEVIALRPFVLNVASELESLITDRELTLSISVGASLPRVHTDPTHLRQILVNLIGNAVKYTPSGGIAVRARLAAPTTKPNGRLLTPEDPTLLARSPNPARSWVALQVIDSGIGIAPADQVRIFDEFEQVGAGPRGDSMNRGTGLGLAISRRLARLLDGDLTVESQPGKGSTFTVWLPAGTGEAVESPAARAAAARDGETLGAAAVGDRGPGTGKPTTPA